MKAKKITATGLAAAMSMAVLAGCGPKSEAATTTTVTIAFDTDVSSMDNSIAVSYTHLWTGSRWLCVGGYF